MSFVILYYLLHFILFGYDLFIEYRGYILGDHSYRHIDVDVNINDDTIIV